MIRQLKKRAIPVAGADRLQLVSHIAVKDLMALGRFALLPHDDLNLATLLKSPFCGVSEQGLFALLFGKPQGQDVQNWKQAEQELKAPQHTNR